MNRDTRTAAGPPATPVEPPGATGSDTVQDIHWFNTEQATLWVAGMQTTFAPAWPDGDPWAFAYGLSLRFE